MKKLIFTIIIISTILLFSTTSYAEEKSGWHTSITVNGEDQSFIKNQYFKLHYDTFFKDCYSSYTSTIRILNEGTSVEKQFILQKFNDFFGSENMKKIGYSLYNEMKDSDDNYYLNLYLNYNNDFSEKKNLSLLSTISSFSEIIYCGSTTPCAIISIKGNNIDKLIANEDIEFINYPFLTFSYSSSARIPENGNREYNPTAIHARNLLRYSAGLYDPTNTLSKKELKEFFIMSDADFDGRITAIDARIALRIAAKLESPNIFTHSTDSFWEDF